jgi:membrane-associated phospholipid phosphatase
LFAGFILTDTGQGHGRFKREGNHAESGARARPGPARTDGFAVTSAMGHASGVVVAGTVGAHALAWYFGLLGLLLVCERFAWSARASRHRSVEGAQGGRRTPAELLRLGVALVVSAAAGFAVTAYVTGNGAFAQADQAFLDALHASMPARVVKHFAWITWFGDARTLALLCVGTVAALLDCDEPALACGLAVAVGGNGLLNTAMKHAFERMCPQHEVTLPLGHGLCFPSGHTSGAVVAYGMLAYVLMRTLPQRWHLPVLMSATALVFTVGWSRVFVEAHFPSDVLAAFASGIAWLALVVLFTESWLRGWRPLARQRGAAQRPAMPG